MAYVAVRGGRQAIEASMERLRYERLKSGHLLGVQAIEGGLRALVDQVMSEGSLYSREIASIAIKQGEGSPEEAAFLMRAYRSTLPRKHYTNVVDPGSLRVERRISACFKDIPGGQILGTSADYTHRLIDFDLCRETEDDIRQWLEVYLAARSEAVTGQSPGSVPKVVEYLRKEGLLPVLPPDDTEPSDITQKSLEFPTVRSERLQILTRGQTGAVIALGYAALRGYGILHPTVGELRVGWLPLTIPDPFGDRDTDSEDYFIGEIQITEVETLVPVSVPRGQGKNEIEFELGYGVCFGQNETKAVAMSLLDQCLEKKSDRYPTHDEEFVLYHIDSVESTGFISHLKLPHYVTFQAKLDSVRKSRQGGDA
jgi:alpha-D-ribose 1-methylphosphonate 5-triphosphate synthase subunit PhnI